MATTICNVSRGSGVPPDYGTGLAKALEPLRISIRSTTEVDPSTMLMLVGRSTASQWATVGVPYTQGLASTKQGSILKVLQFTSEATIVWNPIPQITKTAPDPQPSTFFSAMSVAANPYVSATVSAKLEIITSPTTSNLDEDPMGPVIGLEHGPRNKGIYAFFIKDSVGNPIVRLCGPLVGNIRIPDVRISFDWTTLGARLYTLLWDENRNIIELYVDDETGVATNQVFPTQRVVTTPLSSIGEFQFRTSPVGGTTDVVAVYGVEGKYSDSVKIHQIAFSSNVLASVVGSALASGWRSYRDGDFYMGFSGAQDPTYLARGGAWFRDKYNSTIGPTVDPSGFSRLTKTIANSSVSIWRQEPGFANSSTDGFLLDFSVAVSTDGGPLTYDTGTGIKIEDGQSTFQIGFLSNGSTFDVGLLKVGGSQDNPNDYSLVKISTYQKKNFRLVVNTRRSAIDLYDLDSDLYTPIETLVFDRSQLPTSTSTQIYAGFLGSGGVGGQPIGTMDFYKIGYSYLYQAWEPVIDLIDPTAADPPFSGNSGVISGPLNSALMPGVSPLPYESGLGPGGTGIGSVTSDGYEITAAGGQTLIFTRTALFDSDRGGSVEAAVSISSWHPYDRTGVFIIMDDGVNSFMLSFVETPVGKYVCFPIAEGGGYIEHPGETGLGPKLSVPVDWTQTHVYRIERRPRDGVYIFIDEELVITVLDADRFIYPLTQFNTAIVAFGQFVEEAAVSLWKFVRTRGGAGYELSAVSTKPDSEQSVGMSGALTTTIVSADSF